MPAPVVRPVDTTAAGDSFCGALADGLVRGSDLVEATRWAVRVGGHHPASGGATVAPTPDEVRHRRLTGLAGRP